MIGVPTGSRTPVTGVKGRCPRPLDDGDVDEPSADGPRQRSAYIDGYPLGCQAEFT